MRPTQVPRATSAGPARPAATLHQSSRGFRLIECAALAACFFLEALLVGRLALDADERWATAVIAVVTGILSMDLVSGLVHWAADTWGKPGWPVIGPALIAPFREHHVDPLAITRHDFVEINGSSCLIAVPLQMLALPVAFTSTSDASFLFAAWVAALGFAAIVTNQIHKWAHLPRAPRLAQALQRRGVILSREAHGTHHAAPHRRAYCITTGWLNPLLDRVRFFPALEWTVTALTGAEPRAHERAPGSPVPDRSPTRPAFG